MTMVSSSQQVYLAKINEGQVLRVSGTRDRPRGPNRPTFGAQRTDGLQGGRVALEGRFFRGVRWKRPGHWSACHETPAGHAERRRCWEWSSTSVAAGSWQPGLTASSTKNGCASVRDGASYKDSSSPWSSMRGLDGTSRSEDAGRGVTVPGLIDHRRGLDILSPNVHVIDGHSPGRDLGERLGLKCVMVQDQDALCLAERHFGRARGLEDFAILDVSSGVGMGVMSGGRLVRGHSGFAGEIGHITVVPMDDLAGAEPGLPGNRRQRHRARPAGLSPARPASRHRRGHPACPLGRSRSGRRLSRSDPIPGDRPGGRDQRLQPVHALHSWPDLRCRGRLVRERSRADPQAGGSRPHSPTVASSAPREASGKGPWRALSSIWWIPSCRRCVPIERFAGRRVLEPI